MIKNYFKVALRYLLRYKGYTLINILGLSTGIACCILIMLFVRSEFSYDRFHTRSARIARAWVDEKAEGKDFINTITPIPMGPALEKNIPGIEAACRIYSFSTNIKFNDKEFSGSVHMVDPSLFRIFDFPLLRGSAQAPFPSDHSVILTSSVAEKYFGKEDPLGKNIQLELGDDKVLFTVAGVAADNPPGSSIRLDILIPFANDHYLWNERLRTSSWSNIFVETYVLMREGQRMDAAEKQFPAMMQALKGLRYKPGTYNIYLQPLTAIHLDTTLPGGYVPPGDPKYSYILATIGILILLLACINFITLSVGRSTTRALEVGVRKALGAQRQQLMRQFWGEAFLLTLISVLIGLGLSLLLLGPFNSITNKELSLRPDGWFFLFCLGLIGIVSFIAGIYPAIILSGFHPVEVLKGRLKIGTGAGLLRKTLVAGQFIASISLIVCTLVVHRQLNYLRNKDLGYNKEQVIIVPTNKPKMEGMKLAALYRTELLRHPEVVEASTSLYSFSEDSWINIGYTDDNKKYREFEFNAVDPSFLPTMGIQLAAGRNFSADNDADRSASILVNETLVKEYGWKDPIGQKLPGRFDQRIVGVMKDFNVQSLHTKIRPIVLAVIPDSIMRRAEDISYAQSPRATISVRLKPGNTARQISLLKAAWQSIAPGQEFEYDFLDQAVALQYKQDQRTGYIVTLASSLAIFIACMGLFGLVTLSVTRRTREIGIRKILGAGVPGIVRLISMEFLQLVVIAAAVAFPLSWWAMHAWLQDFAYHIPIEGWVFAAAIALAVLIALATISIQAVRAALANPVKSLRTE
ncbi:MAG TPA: ABC transporter permease [Puia sp.]|nr:ABC transporter permease [Puia sp.]